jgi:hypothetical protein
MSNSPIPINRLASAPSAAPAKQTPPSVASIRSWRERLHNLLFAAPERAQSARTLRLLLSGCAVLSLVLYGLDAARNSSAAAPDPLLYVLHVLTTAVFCADYLARVYACVPQAREPGAAARRWACLRRPEMLLELAVLTPFFLGFWLPVTLDLRFLRAIRLLQLIPSRRLMQSHFQLQRLSARIWPLTLALALALGATAMTLYGALQAFSANTALEAHSAGVSNSGLGSWSTPAAATLVFIVLLLLMLFSGLLLTQQSAPNGPGSAPNASPYMPGSVQAPAGGSADASAMQVLNPAYILGKPEQAVAHFEVLLAQARYLGVLTDHAQFDALARDGHLSSADYALWRHIQGYPLHPLQGGYAAQWRVRYSQPLYKLFTQASTQRAES